MRLYRIIDNGEQSWVLANNVNEAVTGWQKMTDYCGGDDEPEVIILEDGMVIYPRSLVEDEGNQPLEEPKKSD